MEGSTEMGRMDPDDGVASTRRALVTYADCMRCHERMARVEVALGDLKEDVLALTETVGRLTEYVHRQRGRDAVMSWIGTVVVTLFAGSVGAAIAAALTLWHRG